VRAVAAVDIPALVVAIIVAGGFGAAIFIPALKARGRLRRKLDEEHALQLQAKGVPGVVVGQPLPPGAPRRKASPQAKRMLVVTMIWGNAVIGFALFGVATMRHGRIALWDQWVLFVLTWTFFGFFLCRWAYRRYRRRPDQSGGVAGL
jgi:hypothetical protein